MIWLITIDTAVGHEGTLRFAAWLHRSGFTARGGTLPGVHVLPRMGLVGVGLSGAEMEETRLYARTALDQLLDRDGARGAIPELSVVESDTIEQGIERAAERTGSAAIVVARRVRRDGQYFTRLGPVARRLLRRLPRTVIVCPPEFGQAGSGATGAGPVIVGTDFADHSQAAVAFAREFAEKMGRTLLLAHVVPTVSFAADYLGQRHDAIAEARAKEHGRQLRAWAHANDVADAALITQHGEPVRELATLAAAHDAAMVVVGSRRLTTAERVFNHSVGSELAATCRTPVAVVPGS